MAAAGAIALVVLAIALTLLLGSSGGKPVRAASALPAGDTTTAVQVRTLTEHAEVDGTLGYGGTLTLYDRLAGTFTWLPSVGAVIERGGTLLKVNNLPVVLMYGALPAYRTLKLGVSAGPDIAELNENLAALGYDPYGTIDGEESFTAATEEAVKRFQAARGLPQTGEVELGRVVFAPSARRVTTVQVSLGQDPPAAQGKEPHGGKGSSTPKGSSGAAGTPEGESAAGGGEAALTTTATRPVVSVQLEADKQQLARVGERAPVTLPNGQSVTGRITSVGTVASESSSGGGESGKATIPVTLVLEGRVPRLDQAPVTVELVEERRRGVLAVPAGALIATAGGGYAIEVLRDRRRVELAVTPGMFADGYVQIEGAGVYAGLTVTEPSE